MEQSIFSAYGVADIQTKLSYIDAEHWVLLTHLGAAALPLLLFVLGCVIQRQRFALTMGLLTTLTGILVIVLKQIIQQPRPYLLTDSFTVYEMSSGFGMPSGHSANAFVTFFVIGLFVKSRLAWPVVFILIVLAGLSRAYLGVHSLAQVCAGLALGATTCAIYALLTRHKNAADIVAETSASTHKKTINLIALTALTTTGFIVAHFYLESQIASSFTLPASWLGANHQAQQALALFKGNIVNELKPPRLFTGDLLYLIAFFLGICVSLIALPYTPRYASGNAGNQAISTFARLKTTDLAPPINIGLTVLVYFIGTLLLASQFKDQHIVTFILLALLPCALSIGIPRIFLRKS